MRKILKGFTLIELLIVIAIIGILTVALLPQVLKAPAKARDTAKMKVVQDIKAGIEMYISNKGSYPASTIADPADKGCVKDSTNTLLDMKVQVSPCTYYYYDGSASTPKFYAVGFEPEVSDNAKFAATKTVFGTAGKVLTDFTGAGTAMHVITGP
jgi:prepilin-type N-terminal cleavage/methylation domain-containing protein